MQMGGTAGDASTLARTNGAKAAAAALGIKLVEQYSGWDPQKMIDQFKEAMAAKPDGIVIMGHPGEDAFAALVDEAESQGIIVTSGNNPLPNIEAKYQTKGFGYAGANLHDGGYLTGQAMVAAGLKAGDEALVYDIWHQEGRSESSQGIYRCADRCRTQGGQARCLRRCGQGCVVGDPDPDGLYRSPSQSQGDRNPAWQHHRDPAEGARGGRQEAR